MERQFHIQLHAHDNRCGPTLKSIIIPPSNDHMVDIPIGTLYLDFSLKSNTRHSTTLPKNNHKKLVYNAHDMLLVECMHVHMWYPEEINM